MTDGVQSGIELYGLVETLDDLRQLLAGAFQLLEALAEFQAALLDAGFALFQFGLAQVLLAAQLFEAFLLDLQYFGSPRAAALAGFDAFRELLQGRAALGEETVALLGFPLQRLAVVLQALVLLPELLFLFLQLPLLLVQLRLERLQRLLLLERFLLLLAQLLGHAGEVGQGALHVL